jgi:hypothetical protein
MINLCKYKDILGKPREGPHSFRIFNFAIVDILLTILLAYILSIYTKYKFIYTLLFSFIFGIICHKIFCVKTTIDKLLFKNM